VFYRDIAFLAIAVAVLAIAGRHIEQIWFLVLTTIPVVHLGLSVFGEPKVNWTRLLLVPLFVIFLFAEKSRDFWKQMLKHWSLRGLILFVIANVVSGMWWGSLDSVFRSLTYLEPIFFYVLTYYIVRERIASMDFVLRALVTGGFIVACMGFFEMFSQRSIVEFLGLKNLGSEDWSAYFLENRVGLGGRVSSTFLQPVYAGMAYFSYLVVFVVYVALHFPKWKSVSLWVVAFWVTLMIATASRGPIMALFPALLAYLLLERRWGVKSKVVLLAIAAFAAVFIFGSLPEFQLYFTETFRTGGLEAANLQGRLNVTTNLVEVFLANLVFGFGPGRVQTLGQAGVAGFRGLAGIENQYGVILADGGLLAGVSYAVFMVSVLRLHIHASRASTVPESRLLGLMVTVGLVFYFFSSASAAALIGPVAQLVMTIVGASTAQFERTTELVV
jgi:O-antigen ligase